MIINGAGVHIIDLRVGLFAYTPYVGTRVAFKACET